MLHTLAQWLSTPWVYWTLTMAYILTIIAIVAVVVSENRNPVKSLAWVTVLLLLPAVGVILYIVFGRNITNTRMISRTARRRLRKREGYRQPDASRLALSEASRQRLRLARTLTGAPVYTGSDIELIGDGGEMIDRLVGDIDEAREFVNLQFYIFNDDVTGRRVAEALKRAAQRGVRVRVIYDHVGSFKTRRRFFRRLQEAGVEAHPFFKVSFPTLGTRVNWRNHRKIVVIDGRTGYIGGMNLADRYINGGSYGIWRDCHARVTGPVVNGLQYSFAVDWSFMGGGLLDDRMPAYPFDAQTPGHIMQVLSSGPTSRWSNIANVLFHAISTARKRAYIQTPYFLPTESLMRALQVAALSRVDVRIMIPRRCDSAMLRLGSYSYVRDCLAAGIKVYMYLPGMLHSKTLLVDDEFVSVGSTNFDFRSFEHNFEANVFVYSAEVNAAMSRIWNVDQAQCERVTPAGWRKRPMSQRAAESVVRLLSPIL